MSTTPSELPVPPGRHRTHRLNVVLGVAGIVFGAFLGFVLEGIGLELVFSILGLREVVSWWFRTYEVRSDELLITEGILTRHSRVVPYRRVQQVDVRQGLLSQVLGLASLRIETAGSEAGRVNLSLLDRPTAEKLRAFVLTRRASSQDRDHPPTGDPARLDASFPGRALFTLDSGRLILAGVTGDVVVAITVAMIPLLMIAIAIEIGVDAHPAVVVVTVLLAFVLPVGLIVFGAIGTVLTYACYSLSVHGNDLRVDYGLLQVEHLTVPRRRVQLISVTDNPVRRAFGFAAVALHSAAPEGGGGDASGRLTIPLIERKHLPALLAALMDDTSWQVPPLQPRPAAARRRGIVRRSLALAIPALVAAIAAFPMGLVAFLVRIRRHPVGAGRERTRGSWLDSRVDRVRVRCRTAPDRADSSPARPKRAPERLVVPAARRSRDGGPRRGRARCQTASLRRGRDRCPPTAHNDPRIHAPESRNDGDLPFHPVGHVTDGGRDAATHSDDALVPAVDRDLRARRLREHRRTKRDDHRRDIGALDRRRRGGCSSCIRRP